MILLLVYLMIGLMRYQGVDSIMSRIKGKFKFIGLFFFLYIILYCRLIFVSDIMNDPVNISLVNSIITIVTILVGFITTALGILIAIVDNDVIMPIKARNRITNLIEYFRYAIFSGFVSIISSVILLILFDLNFKATFEFLYIQTYLIITSIFLYSALIHLKYTYRLANIMVLILEQLLRK